MTITLSPPPSVPSTPWNYGASVPYAAPGIAQDLTVTLSPGNDSTIVAVFLSATPISAGTLPAHSSPPPGAHLAAVAYNGRATVTVPDQETRAYGHVLVARWGAGTAAATVAVTGQKGGTGTVSAIPYGWFTGPISFATTSATWVDVTGATAAVTTVGAAQVFVNLHLAYTGSNNLTGQARVVVDAEASDASDLDGQNAVEWASLSYVTSTITAGTHTVKVQVEKTGGSGSVTITHADIYAQAQEATGGA